MVKEIPLSQGKVAIVDDEDYDYLNQWKWHASMVNGVLKYAARTIRKDRRKITIRMHTFIMGTPKGMDTDHINHNGFDNRRCNLRICSRSQNLQNSQVMRKTSTNFKGIYWNKVHRKWLVSIKVNHQRVFIGLFESETEAANAYDEAAKKYYGEFANTNFENTRGENYVCV